MITLRKEGDTRGAAMRRWCSISFGGSASSAPAAHATMLCCHASSLLETLAARLAATTAR